MSSYCIWNKHQAPTRAAVPHVLCPRASLNVTLESSLFLPHRPSPWRPQVAGLLPLPSSTSSVTSALVTALPAPPLDLDVILPTAQGSAHGHCFTEVSCGPLT